MNQLSLLLLLLITSPLLCAATPQANGPTPPVEPFGGSVVCPPPKTEATTDPVYFFKSLDRLLTSPATSPFLGDSDLATRRRCYQNSPVNGCTTVAKYRDAAIQVCGEPYLSMLCEDVAWACEEILGACKPLGAGGALVVVDDGVTGQAFVVKMVALETYELHGEREGDDGDAGNSTATSQVRERSWFF
ncbi:hypothetical protein FN846DRAFT_254363 [Sphaerosporella brunnea]|uniref:Uncharacterized protein n=1 Tax=Sphaerosporella brunnea TaxID=1250544 RepID=A0A5J5F825_9PEZI|nr:hypothetical protein FN846DRAFT_254363 [Sphaerosporella brunnea]